MEAKADPKPASEMCQGKGGGSEVVEIVVEDQGPPGPVQIHLSVQK